MRKILSFFLVVLLTNAVFGATLDTANPNTIADYIVNTPTLVYFMSFFMLGILLAFTPCVLPMVPILSGIITGQQSLSAGKAFKLSLSYVLGMALVYALAGMAAGYLGSTVQTILQNPAVIIGFSLIFIAMALSLLGLFEIPFFSTNATRPNTIKARGVFSVALMGGLSTLIVSPCVTAPLLGVLTFIGQQGQVLLGGAILFVLALGMGLPLLVFGAGYGSLLPKSGIWMVRIKQLMALFMLVFAVWMLARIMPSLPSQTPQSPFTVVHSLKEIDKQLQMAKDKNLPVFLEFFAGWCSDCQAMDKKVFNQTDVVDAMQKAINLRVDISEKSAEVAEIKNHYGIYGIPTMMFFCKDGQAQKDIISVGQIDKAQMLSLLMKFKKQC